MGHNLDQTLLIDDRAAVVRTAAEAKFNHRSLQAMAAELGLKENRRKLKILAKCPLQQRALQTLGLVPATEAVVLGTTFSSTQSS